MGIAACLLLGYGVSSAAVAVGWSQYLNQLLDNLFEFQTPEALSNSPDDGGRINLSAVVLVFLRMLLLIRGASESARANAIMVLIKMAILVLFVLVRRNRLTPTTWPTSRRSEPPASGRPPADLLLLHRPGRCLHGRRGDQGPQADDAAVHRSGAAHRPCGRAL